MGGQQEHGRLGFLLKTVSKRFPFLKEEKNKTFSDIVEHCKKGLEDKEVKAYRNVLENEDLLRENYQIMRSSRHSPLKIRRVSTSSPRTKN